MELPEACQDMDLCSKPVKGWYWFVLGDNALGVDKIQGRPSKEEIAKKKN